MSFVKEDASDFEASSAWVLHVSGKASTGPASLEVDTVTLLLHAFVEHGSVELEGSKHTEQPVRRVRSPSPSPSMPA